MVTSPIYVSGSHPTQVNCDGTYETFDNSASFTDPYPGTTTVGLYSNSSFQITVLENNSTKEVTFYFMDVSAQMDDAVVYFVGHPSDTSTNHYDPTQAVWSLGQYGTDPIPTISLEQPVSDGSTLTVSGAGNTEVEGTYVLQDTSAVGTDRVWELQNPSLSIHLLKYSENVGWFITPRDLYRVIYLAIPDGDKDPWELTWELGMGNTPIPTITPA